MHKNATPADIEAHPKFASLQSRFASQDPEWEILQRLGPAQADSPALRRAIVRLFFLYTSLTAARLRLLISECGSSREAMERLLRETGVLLKRLSGVQTLQGLAAGCFPRDAETVEDALSFLDAGGGGEPPVEGPLWRAVRDSQLCLSAASAEEALALLPAARSLLADPQQHSVEVLEHRIAALEAFSVVSPRGHLREATSGGRSLAGKGADRLLSAAYFPDDPPPLQRAIVQLHTVYMGLLLLFAAAYSDVTGEAPPLSEWLGDLLPSLSEYESSFGVGTPGLVPYKRKQYDVPANWKLLVENYLEYYHLPAVHPDSATIPPFPTLRPRHQRMAYHVALFPNTFFSLYPDSLFRVILSPHGAGRTVEQATFLSHRAAFDAPGGEAVLEDMFQFWDLINTQDIDIVKNVHQGTSTPLYTGGRFSFRFEETLHRFQNMVIDKMLVHEPTRYRIPDDDVDYHDLLAAPDPLLPAAASG
ncbi:hypothetical protein EMIHUDRAFT_242541 [Emiliania huxleyi CCMP1516]|uniref:Choline monooxygenase, chloroplastic n=2 Tax=Emiliania huxleyi TaxID=2903 RepID=A0A0D3J8L4_EMIH1|nr:hypothetical protein EMIHUDRAFT_242541 [Emiliania huxleyi CCMP1516]EOD19849.1 hypothetical protein EMIHUDRAFT_242541 [Emiliania huxleyi CCMP1516]|eukprot:XP_005772278.1 hypothetical protein EMIHUDRAFT_242541 [Emiliania huxleyi CCMP1516]